MSELLRKDVLKWIKNLSSGQYKKGRNELVSRDGTKFCCLGVWADQHGATWTENASGLIPIAKGRKNPSYDQDGLLLYDLRLKKGLDVKDQIILGSINDSSMHGFKPVIAYIKKYILPKAK